MDLKAHITDVTDDLFARNLLKVWLFRQTDNGRIIDYVNYEAGPDGTITPVRGQHWTGNDDPVAVRREPQPLLIPADYARALAIELLRYSGDIDPGSAQALRADLEHERTRRDLADDRIADTLSRMLPARNADGSL